MNIIPETITIDKKYLTYALVGIVLLGFVFAVSQGYITIGTPNQASIKNPEQVSNAIVDVGSDIQNLDKSMAEIESGLK